MGRNDLCFCGSGKKQKKCHPDIHEHSLAAKCLNLYGKVNSIINEFYKSNRIQPPPCSKGCYNCCLHLFTISKIEFKIICYKLKEWDSLRIKNLISMIENQWQYIQNHFPKLARCFEKDGTGPGSTVTLMQTFMLPESFNLPCPFLDNEHKTCEIYDVRPFICRCFGTTFYINYEHKICNKIPSNLDNSLRVPNLVGIMDTYHSLYSQNVNGSIIEERLYPLVYWFNILFKHSDGQLLIPFESRDFRQPHKGFA